MSNVEDNPTQNEGQDKNNDALTSSFIVKLNRVDCITLSSVITTSLAVSFAIEGYSFLATSLLFIAMLADAFDGILASIYGIECSFGRYLDGFLDLFLNNN